MEKTRFLSLSILLLLIASPAFAYTVGDGVCNETDFENSTVSWDCAIPLSNLSEIENTSLDGHYVSVNGTDIKLQERYEYFIYICGFYPPACSGSTLAPWLSDETGRVIVVDGLGFIYDDFYNNKTIPFDWGYVNIKAKVNVETADGTIKYADLIDNDYNGSRITRISDEPPAGKEPTFLGTYTSKDDVPVIGNEYFTTVKYVVDDWDTASLGVKCRRYHNSTHLRRIQYYTDGTDTDEFIRWDYYGYTNYTNVNETMLRKMNVCVLEWGTTSNYTRIYGNWSEIYPRLEYFKDIVDTQPTIPVVARGWVTRYPDTPDIILETTWLDGIEANEVYRSAILGDNICSSLESDTVLWKLDNACIEEEELRDTEEEGTTGYFIAPVEFNIIEIIGNFFNWLIGSIGGLFGI